MDSTETPSMADLFRDLHKAIHAARREAKQYDPIAEGSLISSNPRYRAAVDAFVSALGARMERPTQPPTTTLPAPEPTRAPIGEHFAAPVLDGMTHAEALGHISAMGGIPGPRAIAQAITRLQALSRRIDRQSRNVYGRCVGTCESQANMAHHQTCRYGVTLQMIADVITVLGGTISDG